MSQPFEIKSQNSLAAASELLQRAFYNSSVHCSYYGFFQFMLHVLYEELGGNKQADDAQAGGQGGGTHVFTMNQIKNWLEHRTDSQQALSFLAAAYKLKRQRVEADYSEKNFGLKESQKIYRQAQSLIQFLRQNLQ